MQIRPTTGVFLDFMPLPPSLFKAFENESLAAQAYGNEVARAIAELYERKVFVRAIAGDSHPAQGMRLAHGPIRLRLKVRAEHLRSGWGRNVSNTRSALRWCLKINEILTV
jgi:hypothetical protein